MGRGQCSSGGVVRIMGRVSIRVGVVRIMGRDQYKSGSG